MSKALFLPAGTPNFSRKDFEAVIRSSIFRKQIFEINLGEAAGEAFFAEDVGDGLRFALLEVPNFFFDGAGRDEPIGGDVLRLADAVRAIDGLRFDGGVPPGVGKDNGACGGWDQGPG